MKTGLALFCVIGISIVFLAWEKPVEYYSFFPFSDQKLTLQTYVYFLFEHLVLLVVLYLWYAECSAYSKDYVLMFLFLQIGNLIDYLLRYNEAFIHFGRLKVTYNLISIVLYLVFLIYKAVFNAWRQP